MGRGKDVTLRPFLMFRVPLQIHYKGAVSVRGLIWTEYYAETVDP